MESIVEKLEDRKEIIQKYRDLLRISRDILQKEDLLLIRKAMILSFSKFPNQRTPAGVLNVVHYLSVARIVVQEMGLGRSSLISSLLYNLVLTKGIDFEEIKKVFGNQEVIITEGLSKVAELYSKNSSIQTENFRKLLLTFAQDLRVVLIIMAERLETMRKLNNYNSTDQEKIASEVSYLYAPMAHRLGLYTVKSELEDLSLKYLNPEMYFNIVNKLSESKKDRDQYIYDFIKPLKEELQGLGFDFEIKGRTKTIHSIWNKIKDQQTDFENVYDLFAIRIILKTDLKKEKADCWRVYSLVTDKYQPNPSRLRDWLSIPKSNGYESLHTTVLGPQKKWVEVQIRTQRMDEIAEMGLAAHWKYKGGKGESGLDEWLSKVRNLLDTSDSTSIDLMNEFRLDLYDDEVFVFTPKGDLIRLSKGATVLDFAYRIHSGVGNKCTGGIINNRHVPIRHVLTNGDSVEIITSKTQEPKDSWVKVATTSEAKTKIKQALRDLKSKEADLGRDMLSRRLKNSKIELSEAQIYQLTKHFKYKNVNDFFRDIGLEKIEISAVKEFVTREDKKETESGDDDALIGKTAANFIQPTPLENDNSTDALVIDKDLNNVEYKLSKCCNPIFGDEIFAFVAVTGGIKIHRITCPNASELKSRFGYRIQPASWTGGAVGSYSATLKIIGNDELSIVANISNLISKEQKVKMRSISVDSNHGTFEGTLTVFVTNKDVLESVIKKILNLKGVIKVTRIGLQ